MEVATHLAPGIAAGDSVSDAFMADYGARLKIAAGVLFAGALAAAGAAVSTAAGAGSSAAIDRAEAEARRKLGDAFVDRIKKEIGDRVDREINQAFARVVPDPELNRQIGQIAARPGGISIDALEQAGLGAADVARRFGMREDVAALAINAIARRRIYGVSPETYDPASGARIIPISSDRSSGSNSAWALADLLSAQKEGAAAEQIASLKDDYDRATRVETTPSTASPGDILIELLRAQNRGADPRYILGLEQAYQASTRRQSDASAAIAARDSALRGDVDLSASTDRPIFELPIGWTVARIGREIAEAAILTSPAWITWLLTRR